ncbi:MAG: hypothetical protein LBG07_07690, partial [Treponema sp.]|nr:hypothetical protein [Treponema sp.]
MVKRYPNNHRGAGIHLFQPVGVLRGGTGLSKAGGIAAYMRLFLTLRALAKLKLGCISPNWGHTAALGRAAPPNIQ